MSHPLLAVNNLTHLYAPGKGFSDVSFELWPGEVLGIVGESGSGKTTLLQAISARLTPQQGDVRYQNRSLYAMSEADPVGWAAACCAPNGAWCTSIRWTDCAARCRRGGISASA